jgi:hypothetical protein
MHRGHVIFLLGLLALAVVVEAAPTTLAKIKQSDNAGSTNDEAVVYVDADQSECVECSQAEQQRIYRRECQIK